MIKDLDTNLKKAQSRYTMMYESMQGKVDKTEVQILRWPWILQCNFTCTSQQSRVC